MERLEQQALTCCLGCCPIGIEAPLSTAKGDNRYEDLDSTRGVKGRQPEKAQWAGSKLCSTTLARRLFTNLYHTETGLSPNEPRIPLLCSLRNRQARWQWPLDVTLVSSFYVSVESFNMVFLGGLRLGLRTSILSRG